MHCSNMMSGEKTTSAAGSGVDGMKDSRSGSCLYCPMMGYEAASWACQSWTTICCHTLGMNWQGSFLVAVSHHAI